LWDTAGQERFKSVTSIFYKNSHIIFLCYDCTNSSSLKSIKDWMKEKYQKLHMKENVGPGPNDTRPMSNIFMDKFNQMFQSDDFKKEYNPSEYIFLDDEKEEIKNQNNLYDKEFKDISKKYRNFKRKKSWKNK
jgi:hypothetical protein